MGESLKSWWDGFFPGRAAERAQQQERDAHLRRMIENSYESIRVVGRGTIQIDPEEVLASEEFKIAQRQARDIVRACR